MRSASPHGTGNPVAMVCVARVLLAGAEPEVAEEAGGEVLLCREPEAVGNATRSPPLAQLERTTAVKSRGQTRLQIRHS
ncbi:MAG: hypothetical protein ACYDC9_05000, partial [Dermatophilaceae bacterium]